MNIKIFKSVDVCFCLKSCIENNFNFNIQASLKKFDFVVECTNFTLQYLIMKDNRKYFKLRLLLDCKRFSYLEK